VLDLYILKAKIVKRQGDLMRASCLYNEARKLDLADRYLNAVSSRYMIRIDQLKEAEETMALFSKDSGDDKNLNVHDMQCMWYEVECGKSYMRQGQLRLALKNFDYIEKHFEQIYEDQFDFHLYSIRKYTLSSYFEMIKMEDRVYHNKFAVKAAIEVIRLANRAAKLNA
jgi:peptide alpha-N-acetyltransferase